MTFSLIAGSPKTPEELTFVNGALYVVANSDGAFRYDGSWHALNAGLPAGAAWESITGYRNGAGIPCSISAAPRAAVARR